MTHEELARRIAEVALLRGEFTLRSGRKSDYYLDKYRFETQPEVLRELGRMFAELVSPEVDRIAGAELGAVALAATTSLACGKPFVIVRNRMKGYGTGNLVEGVLKPGETVMIVEDVLTTGGQVLEAAKTLEEAGARIHRIVAVIDRQEGARENIESAGYAYHSLFTSADLGIGKVPPRGVEHIAKTPGNKAVEQSDGTPDGTPPDAGAIIRQLEALPADVRAAILAKLREG